MIYIDIDKEDFTTLINGGVIKFDERVSIALKDLDPLSAYKIIFESIALSEIDKDIRTNK